MGAVASVLPPIISALPGIVQGLVKLFKRTPQMPSVTAKRADGAGMTKQDAIAEARARFDLDARYKWNFAVIGQTKAGKSSLVNAFQGLRDSDPRAAQVGVAETTQVPQAFHVTNLPNCVIWDLPGAGTANNPAATYFKDKLLCAFDGLLLVSADTFLEADLEVLRYASKYDIPVALIRTKADNHMDNIKHSFGLGDEEDEAAARILRKDAGANMESEYTKVGDGRLFPSFFIISSRVLYCKMKEMRVPARLHEMDEPSLLHWIHKEADKRMKKFAAYPFRA